MHQLFKVYHNFAKAVQRSRLEGSVRERTLKSEAAETVNSKEGAIHTNYSGNKRSSDSRLTRTLSHRKDMVILMKATERTDF